MTTKAERTQQTTSVGSRNERAELVRVLKTQVHHGRYEADAEQVAEQVLAWFQTL